MHAFCKPYPFTIGILGLLKYLCDLCELPQSKLRRYLGSRPSFSTATLQCLTSCVLRTHDELRSYLSRRDLEET